MQPSCLAGSSLQATSASPTPRILDRSAQSPSFDDYRQWSLSPRPVRNFVQISTI